MFWPKEHIYFYMLFWIIKKIIFIFMHGSNIYFSWKKYVRTFLLFIKNENYGDMMFLFCKFELMK